MFLKNKFTSHDEIIRSSTSIDGRYTFVEHLEHKLFVTKKAPSQNLVTELQKCSNIAVTISIKNNLYIPAKLHYFLRSNVHLPLNLTSAIASH